MNYSTDYPETAKSRTENRPTPPHEESLKSTRENLPRWMSCRDPIIGIFDFRPLGISRVLLGWPVGSGFRQIWQFQEFNGSGEENLAKVSGGICPDGCPLGIQ